LREELEEVVEELVDQQPLGLREELEEVVEDL
jgi:hypothetical protein